MSNGKIRDYILYGIAAVFGPMMFYAIFIYKPPGATVKKEELAADVLTQAQKDSMALAKIKADSADAKKKVDMKLKADKMLSKMRKEVDDMNGTTFYYDPTSPKYSNRNSFHAYLGQKGEQVWMRLKIQYYADDWLFIENFKIKADSTITELYPTSRINRENEGGMIWETCDEPVELTKYVLLRSIANSKSAKIRFNGSQHYDERGISAGEKAALTRVLDLFDAMGGQF